jgi:hypothetical protein
MLGTGSGAGEIGAGRKCSRASLIPVNVTALLAGPKEVSWLNWAPCPSGLRAVIGAASHPFGA